jgi:SAM-dependent methyltransferase
MSVHHTKQELRKGRIMLRLIAGITKRWGSQTAKQRVWDAEYRSGKWDSGGSKRSVVPDPIYQVLDRYSVGARILDLGCGAGLTTFEMRSAFREYVGVDVSDVAIASANRDASLDPTYAAKTRFCVGDISDFAPVGAFDVILFRESIYYLPTHQIKKALDHYGLSLSENGVFIFRLCNRYKYSAIVDLLERNLRIHEKFTPDGSKTVIIVCSPKSRKVTAQMSIRGS